MTRGTASPQGPHCSRATPASSTAAACGPNTYTTASPADCTRAGSPHWPTQSARRCADPRSRALSHVQKSGPKPYQDERSRDVLLLLVGAVDNRPCDRLPEQIEAQVCRRRVLGQVQLFDT